MGMEESEKRGCRADHDSQTATRCGMWSIIHRPSVIKRNNALLWGLAWLIIASIAGWCFRLLPTSAYGVVASVYVPLVWYLVLNVVIWITWVLLFYLVAVVVNRRVDSVDLFGRMLFAHWPVTLVMAIPIIGDRIAFSTLINSPITSLRLSPLLSVVAILVMLFIGLWWLYWSYLAFRESTQLTGRKSVICFVLTAPLAWLLSHITTRYVIVWLLG